MPSSPTLNPSADASFGTPTTILLGAGFSRWSCGLPLVSELFDFKVEAYNETEARRLGRLKTKYEKWKSANPTEPPEAFIHYAQGAADRFNLTNWYVTRRLTDPFVVHSTRRYTWYINSRYADGHQGINKAREFLSGACAVCGSYNLSILTTNYDLVVEYALGTRGFNYGVFGEQIGFTPYPHPRPVYATGPVSIAKLHGSISWNRYAKFPDSRCGLTGQCLIVPPMPEKKAPALLKSQWDLAGERLAKCRKFIVFGFSFNEYDTAIRNFVSTRLPLDADITLIDVVDHRNRLAPLFNGWKPRFIYADDPALSNQLQKSLMLQAA